LDSLLLIYTEPSVEEKYGWHTLRAGYEHRFGKRRVKFVLGLEVLFGIEKWEKLKSIYKYETTQYFDTTRANYLYIPDFDFSSFPSTITYNTLSFMIGVTPVIGVNVNLTKRWTLSGNFLIDQFWTIPFNYSDEIVKEDSKGYGTLQSPLTDISVTFNF